MSATVVRTVHSWVQRKDGGATMGVASIGKSTHNSADAPSDAIVVITNVAVVTAYVTVVAALVVVRTVTYA